MKEAQPTSQENRVLYEQLLLACLEKIKKTVPKKYKELREFTSEALETVKADRNQPLLSANKYFRIFKLALDTKIPRLTESILYHIQKLVAHGLMDGNHPDDCLYPDGEKPKSNGTLPRRLIDAIVDEVCKQTAERDQQVQLQVVRALLTLVATPNIEVHERSLVKVMSSLYFIHIASTNQVNQSTAKASLMQIISIVLKKMETHSADFGDTLKRLNSLGEPTVPELSKQQSATHLQTGRPESQGLPTGPDQVLHSEGDVLQTDEGKEETLVTFSPEEQYAHTTLQFCVDMVCIQTAKVEEIESTYSEKISSLPESESTDEEKDRLTNDMHDAISSVPLYVVSKQAKPKKKGEEAKKEERPPPQGLLNELGHPCGKFGWCITCRATANLYCKHTRHPVCSFECKQRHIQLLELANATSDDYQLTKPTSSGPVASKEEPYTRDALLIFNKLCMLLQSKDLDGKLDNIYGVRKVLLGLDLIHSCLENPGPTFINRKEFIDIIRVQLCNALLKFAVSSEHKIFSRTVSIFYCLFLHFREHLKQTTAVFIDNFFLKILDSGNSEYDYKYSILEFFDRISENAEHLLEIFANYDCDISHKDICFKIVDSLSCIAQGRFQKNDHSSVITPQQEASIRRQALEILIKILRNLNRSIEAQVKLEAQTQAAIAEHRQASYKRNPSSSDNRINEDDSNSRGDQSQLMEPDVDYDSGPTDHDGQKKDIMEAKQQLENRRFKQEMVKAAQKFNMKPKIGLQYLTEKGHLKKEPREEYLSGISKFLKETPALSPTSVGQFLGEASDLSRDVLNQYIEEFDWTSPEISYVEALKMMLSGFRIPGEGQIVDRIMQKFGEKLSKDRPLEFGNAEGVYFLAYATMMLQTSIHNPQAQKMRMKIDDFRKITKGTKLNDQEDFDFDKFLCEIYETVEKEPFTLEEDEEARMKLEAQSNTNKKVLFDKEREGLLRRGATILKQEQNRNNKFVLIKDISTIRPMFENTWSANLAVFSVVLDESDDIIITDLCLQGFMHAIRISGHFEIQDVRDAFVSSLSKFTQVSATREIKQKNINCIRELLNLAIHDGDCLRESWSYVLECISKIDHMRTVGLGDLTDSEYFQSDSHGAQQAPNHQLLMRNSQIIAEQIDANQIETIFMQSENLNQNAIIDFIKNLCIVSKDELADEDNPKKFCLQKLVEVASLNMNRVRFQWKEIWKMMGEHFVSVGSHKNLNVAIYAIDSLRQLSDKFLQKDEHKNFSYQKDFLKPFETIMLSTINSRQPEVKEYIVMCIAALCHQKAQCIRSGWEVILNIFNLVVLDQQAHLMGQSFKSLSHAVNKNNSLIEESFIELVNCLGKFSNNPMHYQDVMELLDYCVGQLKTNPEVLKGYLDRQGIKLFQKDKDNLSRSRPEYGITQRGKAQAEPSSQPPSKQQIELSVHKELWFPVLRMYTGLVMDKNEQISFQALQSLKTAFSTNAEAFGESLWWEIFSQVLLPLLNDIQFKVEEESRKGNIDQVNTHLRTIHRVLELMNNFLIEKSKSLPVSLLVNYSDILCLFASKVNSLALSKVAMSHLQFFLTEAGVVFNQADCWSKVIHQLQILYQVTEPKFLIEEMRSSQNEQHSEVVGSEATGRSGGSGKGADPRAKFQQCYAKCSVQLQLSSCIQAIVQRHFDHIHGDQVQILLGCLDSQYKLAKEFNSELKLRLRLWKEGYMSEANHVPGLLDIEEESLKVYLSILFKQYFKKDQMQEDVSQPLFELCTKVLKDYVLKQNELISISVNKDAHDEDQQKLQAITEVELQKQLQHQSPIIHEVILENLLQLEEGALRTNLKEMGQLLIDLTLCSDYQVRAKNHKLLTAWFTMFQA